MGDVQGDLDTTSLLVTLGVGAISVAAAVYCLGRGQKAAKKLDITKGSKGLDKQRQAAKAANRKFEASLEDIFTVIDKNGDGTVCVFPM